MKKRRVRKVQSEPVQAFAQRLREFRKARGYSQMRLSIKSGVNLSYLNRLETAQAEPGLDLISRLANALDVSISELCSPPEKKKDMLPVLRNEAREHLERVLELSDSESLRMLTVLASLLASALARNR